MHIFKLPNMPLSPFAHRLLSDARKLKSLRVDHNRLVVLPPVDQECNLALEEVLLQHNLLTALPPNFLVKANK